MLFVIINKIRWFSRIFQQISIDPCFAPCLNVGPFFLSFVTFVEHQDSKQNLAVLNSFEKFRFGLIMFFTIQTNI